MSGSLDTPRIRELLATAESFIKHHAQRYAAAYRVDAEDLMQAGRLRACQCARRFDESCGTKFVTYCAHHVLTSMRREGMKFSAPVRRPVATFFTVPAMRFELDAPYVNGERHDDGKELLDLIDWEDASAADDCDRALIRRALHEAMGRLCEVHRDVIRWRFAREFSIEQIAILMGRTRQRVYQVISEALLQLRFDPAIQALRSREDSSRS